MERQPIDDSRIPPDENIGTIIDDRYRIDQLIGQGGMSKVYLGYDHRLARAVAVKIINPQFSYDPVFLARFQQEARSVTKINDPGIVAIYDQHITHGFSYIVMELVIGGTVKDLLKERGPMPPYAAAAIAIPTLTALKVAHNMGIIHRDIKTENILISETGTIKIADFGLVKTNATDSPQVTTPSLIVGTVDYVSPEQINGDTLTPASDVYSMGIMLFEILTGKLPFSGNSPLATAFARLNTPVPLVSSVIAGIDPGMDEIVKRATSLQPQDRYTNAGEMLAALQTVNEQHNYPLCTIPAPAAPTAYIHHIIAAGPTPTVRTHPKSMPKTAPAVASSQPRAAAAPTPTTTLNASPKTLIWTLGMLLTMIILAGVSYWFGTTLAIDYVNH